MLTLSPVDAALRAIAEPRRRDILRLVWDAELPAGEIAARFSVTRPAISQHLKVLKEAGLVTDRPDGARRVYQIDPKGLGQIRAWLDQFWDSALDAFKAEVDRNDDEEKEQL